MGIESLAPDFAAASLDKSFFGPLRHGLLDGQRAAFSLRPDGFVQSIVVGEMDFAQEQVTEIYLARLAPGEPLPAENSGRRLDGYLGSSGLDLARRWVLNSAGRRGYPELQVPEMRDGLLGLSGSVKSVGLLRGGGVQLYLLAEGQTKQGLEADAKLAVAMFRALQRDRAILAAQLANMPAPPVALPIKVFFGVIALCTVASVFKNFPPAARRSLGALLNRASSHYDLPPARAPQYAPSSRPKAAPPAGAEVVSISILKDGFKPAGFIMGSHDQPDPLSSDRPAGLVKEPAYRGRERRYGSIKLGSVHAEPFSFALDLVDGPHPVLYFDRNHNGDLSDDSPLQNQGTGVFAATVSVPFRDVVREAEFPGDYQFWLFTNDSLWKNACLAHYSRMSLGGTVLVGGKPHRVWLIEGAANDADYAKAGVGVDLNGDGRFDWQTELARAGQPLTIGGRAYAFSVGW